MQINKLPMVELISTKSKIALAIGLILIPITMGMFGYMIIEGVPLLDALFMTVTTISTVGYGEVFPLSTAGRIFTIVLILSNLGVFAYAITLITRFLIEGNFFQQLKIKRMKDKIQDLNQHVIVCGFGRNGQAACEMLKKHEITYVILESKKELLEKYLNKEHFYYLNEDATKDESLLDAGIMSARGLITTLPNDADNVFVALTARGLNSSLTIISRASNSSSFTKLKRAGADNVIMPDQIGGAHMASLIVRPDVNEFVDILAGQGGADVQLEEFSYERLKKKLEGITISDLNIRKKSGANVIGLRRGDGSYIVNPNINMVLEEDMKLIILANSSQMETLKEMID
ncbi:MAG: potassium channel protein [Bacteroidia bacterium]|nr:potassium channel protein [Bacteroidia bacterium]MCF8428142.1 potassium channel protein [Bacteroidia bacterium]